MVAIVGGGELGLGTASGLVLGSRGQVGARAQGRSGEGVAVNAVTGNLILQRQDELLLGRGPDIGVLRTYNSLGQMSDDNADNWRLGFSRKVYGLSGTAVNTAGSTIKRIDEDGAEVTYSWDATRSAYVTTKGDGAYDLLTYNSSTNRWTWTDGSTQTQELYDNANGGRLIEVSDADGNKLTIGYTGALVASITDANGERTEIVYDTTAGKTSNILEIRTRNSSNTLLLTRVRYSYDTSNRLSTVTVDLSPTDNSVTDGKTYVTTYTYDGTSKRVASLQQSDGSRLEFTYDSTSGKVLTVKDVRGSDIRTTTYAYDTTNRKTSVTDPVGQITELTYDTNNQLLSIKLPAVGGVSQITSFTYDANGNVATVTDARGYVITYGYDGNGNRILERDAAGNTIARSYGAQNQLLTETTYTVPDPDGAGTATASGALTTRYVYDAKLHLRFVVSPEGRVTEYRYNATGQQTSAIAYTANLYTVSGLTDTQSPTEAQLATWLGGVTLAQSTRIDMTYDVRGQADKITRFASVDAAGNGVADGTQSTTQYVYDQAGLLLQAVDARGVATTAVTTDYITSYTYDGLGRQLNVTNALGQQTATVYDDANRKTTLTLTNGLVTATTYDQGGAAISVARSGSEGALGTITYTYDKLGRLAAQTDPTGVKQFWIYDEAGRQVGFIDGVGAFTEYVYNGNNQLTRTIQYNTAVTAAKLTTAASDPTVLTMAGYRPAANASDRIEYRLYDSAGNLKKVIDGIGALIEYFYDGAGRLTDTLQYATLVSSSQLSALKALTAEIVPTNSNATVAASAANDRRNRQFYSADGLLLGSLDGEGYLTEHLYNAAGLRTQSLKYATVTASANWSTGTLATLRPAANTTNDQSTFYLYNGKGQLIGLVDAEGYLTEYQYDLVGNKTAEIRYATKVTYAPGATLAATKPTATVEDQKTLYTYDALNRLVRIDSLPDGLITTYAYDTVGNLTQTVKALGAAEQRTETRRYDSLGRIKQELTAEGAKALAALGGSPTQAQIDTVWTQYGVTHAYDTASRRISSTDQNGNKTLFYYNANNQLTHTINGLGEVVAATYNLFGDITATRRYATRISSTTLATLTGGLANATLTSAVSAITNATLDTVESTVYNNRGEWTSRVDARNFTVWEQHNAFRESTLVTTKLDTTGTLRYDFNVYNRRGDRTALRLDTDSAGGVIAGSTATTSYTYDAFGRITRTTDARGKNWDATYDRLGRTVTTTEPGTAARVISYDAFDRVLTRKDALGNTTTYVYDTTNRKVTITSPEGIATSTIRNRHGETVSVTDGRGNITSYTYDDNGQLKTVTTATGTTVASTTTQNYDRAGQRIETIDANGIKTAYTYDAAGRVLTRSVDPTGLNLTSKTFYDAKGQAVWQQDANGIWSKTEYNVKGEVTSVIIDPATIPNTSSTQTGITLITNSGALNLRTDYTYDGRGKILMVTEGVGSTQPKVTQYTYDDLGRRTQEAIDPAGLNLRTTYTYDLNDNLVAKTDALNNVTRYVYSDKNQQIYSVDATGAVIKTDYDGEGRVIATTAYANRISLTSPTVLGATITAADITGRLTANAAADQINRAVYDKDGRVKYRVDALNFVTELTYDATSNVIQTKRYARAITVPGTVNTTTIASAITTAGVDAKDQTERTVYDAANRAIVAIDAENYVTQSFYDSVGRVTKQVRYTNALAGTFTANVAPQIVATAPGSGSYVITNANDRTTRTVYDAAGRARFSVDGEGYVIERLYDAQGRETKRLQYGIAPGVVDADTVATLTTKVAAGVASAVTDLSAYDDAGRLIRTTDAEGVITLHVYDAVGRETDTTVAYGTSDASTTHRVFNAAGYLLEETQGYGKAEAATTRYTLDALGQRIAIVDPRGVEQPALIAQYTTTQTFDAEGRVTQVIDPFGKTIQTQYDAFGNAVKVTDQRGNAGYFYFDKANRNTWQVDPEGYATKTVYNAFGTVDSITRYANKITGTPVVGTVPTVTANASKDQITLIEHDRRDLQTKITDAENNYETMAYDAFGNKTSYRNKLGGVFTYTFDRKGNVKQETAPAISVATVNSSGVITATASQAVVKQFTYDARGNVIQIIEAAGTAQARTTDIQYDKLNRETRRDLPTMDVFNAASKTNTSQRPYTTTTYDKRGNVVETRNANGDRMVQYYDALNRQVASVDPTGTLSETVYDDVGNVTRTRTYATRLAMGSIVWTTKPSPVANDAYREMNYVYDANNRQVSTKTQAETLFDPINAAMGGAGYLTRAVTTLSFYDATGNVVKTVDGRGFVTLYFYDKLGQQILSVDALGYVVRNEYDGNGNLVRQSKYEQKLSNTTIQSLTENSNPQAVITEVAGIGQDRVTEADYDRLSRKIIERTLSVRYASVNDVGALSQYEQTIQSTYQYDAAGNLTQEIKADGSQTNYDYDVVGQLVRQTDPSAAVYTGMTGATVNTVSVRTVTEWQYDALGNRTVQTRYGATAAENQVTKSSFDAQGNVRSEWDAIGYQTTYDVDAAGRILRQSKTSSDVDNVAHSYRTYFAYDAQDREIKRQTITDEGAGNQVIGDTAESSYNAFGDVATRGINGIVQHEYRYDKLGHLFWTNADSGTPRIYVYDASGNSVLEVSQASGTDLNTITTVSQVAGLAPSAVQMKFSIFDARNQITDVYQAPMDFTDLTGALTVSQQQQLSTSASSIPGAMTYTGGSDPDGGGTRYDWVTASSTTGNYYTWSPPANGPTGASYYNAAANNPATGQAPVSLAPWTTDNWYTDSPTQKRHVVVTRTASSDGITVWETITTTTDTIVTTVNTGVTTGTDTVDYQAGTATVGNQTTTNNTTTTTTRTVSTSNNYYQTYQTTNTVGDVVGGATAINSQLIYTAPQTITMDFVMSEWGEWSDQFTVPSFGVPVTVAVVNPDGSVTVQNSNHTQAQQYWSYGWPPGSRVVISMGSTVLFDQALMPSWSWQCIGGGNGRYTYVAPTQSAISIRGADVHGASVWLSNGQSAGLTYGVDSWGSLFSAAGIGAGWENFEYALYTYGALVGNVRGNLSTPWAKSYLYWSRTDTAYWRAEAKNVGNNNYTQTDTAQSIEQRNYLRQLMYSLVSGTAQSNQIHRSTARNAFGEVISETDGRGNVTQYAYNELGKVIRKQDPSISYTGENGVVVNNFTPVTEYYVDALGNTVASMDANGFVTKQAVRNGRLTAQFNPDAGVEKYYYDHFGNLVAKTDGIGLTSRYTYNKNNQLTRTDFAGGNYDIYDYNALGQRIAHTNGLGNRETYLYDAENRITRYRSNEGRVTSYSYTFVNTIGERGGYRKITTDVLLNTQSDDVDMFGKIRAHTDLGGHTYTYSYNAAGWLLKQTSSVGQNIDYAYYNNGYLKAVNDIAINSYALFQYDKDGNRTLESYAQQTLTAGAQSVVPYQVAKSSYDALNRVTTIEESGKFSIKYEYDKVGNRRRVLSRYTDLLTNAPDQVQDFWYKYDALNRFTTTMGSLVNGQIVRGANGYDISYNAINQRMTQTSTDTAGKAIKETYTYDNNGFLTTVNINPDAANVGGIGAVRAQRVNNAVGDRVRYIEYNAQGIATSGHQYTYDKDHNLTREDDLYNTGKYTQYTLTADGRTNTITYVTPGAATVSFQYAYESWDSYQQQSITVSGSAQGVNDWKNGVSTFTYDVNGHVKQVYDRQEHRTVQYVNNQNGQTLKRLDFTGTNTTAKPVVIRDFYYFNGYAVGDQGTDKVASRIDYAQSLRGTVLEGNGNKTYIKEKRTESMTTIWEQWASRNGSVDDYQHSDIGTKVDIVSSVDFDQNFMPINEGYPGMTVGTYVVRLGDTLQSIAASVWGDSALWYLIADANGLRGTETLTADMRLTLPNVVTNIHNNASTHRLVDPGLSLGNTQPTLPEPPPPPKPKGKKGKCGGIGTILVVVIAVVATIFTAGAALTVLAPTMTTGMSIMGAGMAALGGALGGGVALGAAVIGGALGSMVSQGAAMAMGMQDKFSWGQVATSAIGAGVGAGVGAAAKGIESLAWLGNTSQSWGGFGAAMVRGAISSVATQGLSVAVGLQKKFSWTQVAASAVGTGVGQAVGGWIGTAAGNANWGDTAQKFAAGFGGSLASGAASSLISREKPNWGLIAANSFGSALGNSIADRIVSNENERIAKGLLKDAGIESDARDHRYGVGFVRDLLKAGATPEQVAKILANGNVRDFVGNQNAIRSGGVSDDLAEERASSFVDQQLNGEGTSPVSSLGEVVVEGEIEGLKGDAIVKQAIAGGANLLEAITSLSAEHGDLASFLYEAGKATLAGGPLKTVVTKVAKIGLEKAASSLSDTLSAKAQDATARFVTQLARDNDLSFDMSVAGVDVSITADTIGMIAGQVSGSVVDAFFDAGLRQITARGEDVRNIVGGRRGNQRTRDDVDLQRDRILQENPTWKHRNGGTDQATGRPLPEMYVPGQNHQRKGSTYPDLTFEKPDGTLHHHNTVDTYSDGTLTKREAENLERLRQLRQNDTATTSPKPR